jgi:hypothetical protein
MWFGSKKRSELALLSFGMATDFFVILMFASGLLFLVSEEIKQGLLVSYMSLGLFPLFAFLIVVVFVHKKPTINDSPDTVVVRAKQIVLTPFVFMLLIVLAVTWFQFFQDYFGLGTVVLSSVLFAQYLFSVLVNENKYAGADGLFYLGAFYLVYFFVTNQVIADNASSGSLLETFWQNWPIVVLLFASIRLYRDSMHFIDLYYGVEMMRVLPYLSILSVLLLLPFTGFNIAIYILFSLHLLGYILFLNQRRKKRFSTKTSNKNSLPQTK